MYHPPFHRRILPWIFTIAFLATAPAVIFYTAGYRWNPKKEKVERQGTLILDSHPKGAHIFIDGIDTQKTTPLTLQDVNPGRHRIRLEYPGYTSWEKRLDVSPERVTFANTIWLWKEEAPILLSETTSTYVENIPQKKHTLLLSRAMDRTSVELWSPNEESIPLAQLPFQIKERPLFFWSENNRFVLIEVKNGITDVKFFWIIDTAQKQTPLELPAGSYRWNGSRLEGISGKDLITLNPASSALTRVPLGHNLIDASGDFTLETSSSTDHQRILLDKTHTERGFILPKGSWSFFSIIDQHVMLRDGQNWMSIDLTLSPPTIHHFQGDILRPFIEKHRTRYLALQNNEIWIWDPSTEPELISRESLPVTQTIWHTDGKDIFLIASSSIVAINLDARDNRIRTTLASFDEIKDLAFVKNQLLIAGRAQGRSGIWTMNLE